MPDTDDLPDNAEGQVAETPTEDVGENPADEPVDPVDDGYWHDDTPTVTAADLQAAAEAEMSTFISYLESNGWNVMEDYPIRQTDTQYGYYFWCVNPDGSYVHCVVKAETSDGVNISVGWYSSTTDIGTNYDSFTNGPYGPSSVPLR